MFSGRPSFNVLQNYRGADTPLPFLLGLDIKPIGERGTGLRKMREELQYPSSEAVTLPAKLR
jgi:hypothetical protein